MRLQLSYNLAKLIATTLLIAGCGQFTHKNNAISEEPTIQAASLTTQTTIDNELVRAIPNESIYPLLLAEFALRNKQYSLALENYLGQSAILEDAGVSSLTTKLAQFLNDDKAALQAARQWVMLEPQSLEANQIIANLLGRNKQPLEAFPYMTTVLRKGGKVNFTALAITAIRLDQNIQLETLMQLGNLLNEFPDNIELKLAQSIVLKEQQRYSEALRQIRDILKTEPYQLQAIVLEADISQRMGKRNSFTRILKTLQQQPENHRLRIQYAHLLATTDINAARKQFAILVNYRPNNPDILYSYALINWEMKDFDAASKSFLQLLSMDKHSNEAHFYLGRYTESKGDLQAALKHYLKVTLGPHFVAASHRLGSIWANQGEISELASHFEQLRKNNPSAHARLFLIEAETLLKQQFLNEAITVLSKGIRMFPNGINLRYARSLIGEKLGNIVLMERDLRAIIAQDPNNTSALNALGYGLTIHTHRYQEAYKLLQRAIRISPDEPAILDSLGWVQFRLGMKNKALNNLQRAHESFPDPEISAHLGEVLWSLGYKSESTSILKKSLKKSPNNIILLEVIRRLVDGS